MSKARVEYLNCALFAWSRCICSIAVNVVSGGKCATQMTFTFVLSVINVSTKLLVLRTSFKVSHPGRFKMIHCT